MKTIRSTLINCIAATFAALMLTACGSDSDGGGGTGSSGLSLSITDAPVNSADVARVMVRFTKVVIHPGDGDNIEIDIIDPDNPDNHFIDIDLMQLTQGTAMLLGEFPLDPGNYQWARLEVDLSKTYVEETDGGMYPMDCPSCAPDQSGLKLNRPYTIEEEGWVAWTIDFDLLKSLTMHPEQEKVGKNKYRLRPTLRILETELASAYIHGSVTDNRAEMSMFAPDDCWVYVYEGSADVVDPDDLCFTSENFECETTGSRPLLAAPVEATANLQGGTDYTYKTGFLYPDSLDPVEDTDLAHDGLYTVALLCDETGDNRDEDEGFAYIGEATVSAPLPGGYLHDFGLEDVDLSLVKSGMFNDDGTTEGVAEEGETISYTFVATNEGSVELTGVTVSDPLPGLDPLVCNPVQSATLAPGDSMECNSSYILQQADVEAGQVVNTATATYDGTGEVSSNQVTVTLPSSP